VSEKFVALGDVAQFINGAAFKPEDWGDEGLQIIRIQNLTDRTKTFNRTKRVVADKLYVQPGDLLVSWSATLGVFVWDREDIGLLNQHIFRVIPDESKVSKPYLRHSLEGALASMQRHMHGATMQHVNRGNFLATLLYLPPLKEQHRIAAILDQAETLRTQRRAALAQLDSLTQSIFLEMFGDPNQNNKGWPMGCIKDTLVSASYGTSEKSGEDGEFAVLRMNNITRSGELDMRALKYMDLPSKDHERYLVKPGDILFNRTNSAELVGKTAFIPQSFKKAAYAGYLIRLRSNSDNHPVYLWRFLNSDYAKRMLRGMCKSIIGMANINASEIQAMRIALPPLSLQEMFASRIQTIEAFKTTHSTALAALDDLFASLQHRAFSGTI
jgi:type I restriction enzyme, S subunit